MSQDLQIALSTIIAAIVGWLVRQFIGNKQTPANPSNPEPDKLSDSSKPDSSSDPFAPLPGMPGHPLLNFLAKAFLRWLGLGGSVKMFAAISSDESEDEAALQLVATAMRSDPKRLERMKTLLN